MPTIADLNASHDDIRHRQIVEALLKIVAEISGLKSEVQTLRHAISEAAKRK